MIAPTSASVFDDPIPRNRRALGGADTFNPAAGTALYRAKDDTGAMQIGDAHLPLGSESADGIHFTRRATPVFFPAHDNQRELREWPGGIEDPRIVEAEDGTYVLTYTQWNRKTYSVGIATSPDLEHWTQTRPRFLTRKGESTRA